MKWSLIVGSVIVMFVAGSLPAGATEFTGVFSGAAEDPPNDSPGTGTAEVELDPVLHLLRVDVTFSGLMSPTTIAHIHCCAPPGQGAGVATAVPTFPGFPADVTSGSYQMSFDTTQESTFNPAFIAANGGTAAGAEAALLAGLNDGMAYFNIHTMMFQAGEIRADLSSVEPGTPSPTLAAGTPTDTAGVSTPTGTPGASTPTATLAGATATATIGGGGTATATLSGATATATLPAGTATATITPLTPAGTPTVTPTGMGPASPTMTSRTTTVTPAGGTPTVTTSPAVGTATVTPSRGTVTASPARTGTRTAAPSFEDDGCSVVAPDRSGGFGALLLLFPAALLAAARRRRW